MTLPAERPLTRTRLQLRALLLALLGVWAFAGLPLLHAAQHGAEERLAREGARRLAFQLGFLAHRSAAQEARLRAAVEVGFGGEAPRGEGRHLHGEGAGHSHGGVAHGAGALEHLGAAVAQAAPALELSVAALPEGRLFAPGSEAVVPRRYLVPRFAQGPPVTGSHAA